MRLLPSLLLFASLLPAFAEDTFLDPQSAGPDFSIQGEYLGEGYAAQVIALGDGKFHLIGWRPGLPALAPDAEKIGESDGVRQDGKVLFTGATWKGEINPQGDLMGTNDDGRTWTLHHTLRESPRCGAKPPTGAIVLFDGSNTEAWQDAKLDPRGFLQGGTKTKASFGDCTLHVEFRTPFKPNARGQARGNSGVYLQDRFECQILDSFALSGEINETGAIYSISKPRLNACLPPLSWQSYDIDFTAARYDAQGLKTAHARMSVTLNGVPVQDNVEVPHITTSAGHKEGPEPAPIQLQNHGNPVVFRNVWILEKH